MPLTAAETTHMAGTGGEVTNKKSANRGTRPDSCLIARAGLIPASDDVADERRARTIRVTRMIRAARRHPGIGKSAAPEFVITDLLVDLRHYCDSCGLPFERLSEAALQSYLGEADCMS